MWPVAAPPRTLRCHELQAVAEFKPAGGHQGCLAPCSMEMWHQRRSCPTLEHLKTGDNSMDTMAKRRRGTWADDVVETFATSPFNNSHRGDKSLAFPGLSSAPPEAMRGRRGQRRSSPLGREDRGDRRRRRRRSVGRRYLESVTSCGRKMVARLRPKGGTSPQVAAKVRNLVIYFDHEDLIGGVNWDDIVANPVSPLSKVISPGKVEVVPKKPREKLPIFYTNLKKGRIEQNAQTTNDPHVAGRSGSEEEDFWDSDNEVEEGDADLFEDLIDAELDHEVPTKSNKKAKGRKVAQVSRPSSADSDDATEDERLELPYSDSDEEGQGHAFHSFVEDDLSNPSFNVGLVFSSIEKLREAITESSVRNTVEIKVPRNDKTRLRAHCAENCPWNLYASFDSRAESFVVKTYYGKHRGQKEWSVRKCSATWLATKYYKKILTPSRSKLARARRLIMKAIHGDEAGQFNQLWDYGQELRRSNIGSSLY
ncbi:hypothetical protein U9M48_002347, partial [Paspalum notatum var. saurae]